MINLGRDDHTVPQKRIEESDIEGMFDSLDTYELSLVLRQLGKRMLILRQSVPDSGFWFGVVERVSQWLQYDVTLNEDEKKILIEDPRNRSKAMLSLRRRTGMKLCAVKEIVETWMRVNKIPQPSTPLGS